MLVQPDTCVSHSLAHRRTGDPEFVRRAAETAQAGYGDECLKVGCEKGSEFTAPA